MFIDSRKNDDLPVTDYDLLIVGGGPAGITLAHELRNTGLRIALLESGDVEFDGDTQELYEGRIEGNDDEFDLAACRLRMFGGTSNHWGGHCTPLDPIDFDRSPGNGMSGWPFSRKDLDPFYERAHVYCDLGAYDYDIGSLPSVGPDDLLLPEHPLIETAMLRQSLPTRFGEKYYGALNDSPSVDVWLWTNVTHLNLEPDGALTSVITKTLGGVERTFTAKSVVLACGAVENARLLLASNAQNGSSFGNGGDLLGRCYMDHPSGGAAFVHFATPLAPKVYWSSIDEHAVNGVPVHFVLRPKDSFLQETGLPNSQYYVIPFETDDEQQRRQTEANKSLSALKKIAKWSIGKEVGIKFQLSEEYCQFITNADSFLADRVSNLTGTKGVDRALLKYETEQRPTRASFVALDSAKDALGQSQALLRWSPTKEDIDAIIQTATQFGAIFGETGLGRLQLEDHDDDPYWGTTTAWHQLGTTRMAEVETSGVVDPDGKLFGTRSVYIAGGSIMPTGGRANPTLTIVALSIRLADHLARKVPTL